MTPRAPDARHKRAIAWLACALGASAAISVACRQDMHDQPRYEALERSEFFLDGRSARPRVEGTVARGELHEDEHFFTGRQDAGFSPEFPLPVTRELLARGRERYGIHCTPCHGLVGRGDGAVVRRGYRKPNSFHVERLRMEPVGYFFDVISKGFGTMPDYAAQVPVRDRWAIVAYIRALQISQGAGLRDVPPEHRAELGASVNEP